MTESLTVCYFGTYRAEYSRNIILIKALRSANVRVIECQVELWHGIDDRVEAVKRGFLNPALWKRVIRVYFQLLKQYRSIGYYDVMVIGYPGQFDVFLGRLLTWLRGKKLVWDVFMSIYLISVERGLSKANLTAVKMLKLVEKSSLQLPDRLILDTQHYADWFIKTYKIAGKRFRLVPTGADDQIFTIPAVTNPLESDKFRVIYYGTFIPNHGVDLIVEAANILKGDSKIDFVLIGDGPDRNLAEEKVRKFRLNNVAFINWLDKESLKLQIANSDLCLGAFGNTPQSLMTIQNKIYECMAMGKPVLTGDSPAIRSNFSHKKHLYISDRTGISIAAGISDLFAEPDLRHNMAEGGYKIFREKYCLDKLGKIYSEHIRELIA